MMQYISSNLQNAVADIQMRLISELQQKKVLWLVSGGSNVTPTIQIIKNIPESLTANLTIMLADERYGEVGHKDSNWALLLDAGLAGNGAHILPVLHEGLNLEETSSAYNKTAGEALASNDFILALLGIGSDGHIAGILPGSVATEGQDQLVIGYQSQPFQRITLTFEALRKVDADYSLCFGDSKKEALLALRDQDLSLDEQPAQILKQLPESYIYTDQLREKI